jgi:hypothetical protein
MKTIAQQLNIKEFPFEIKDKNGYVLYAEYSTGDWYKCELDEEGNERYYEDSGGEIIDNRVKEMTISEIEKALNINNLKIIK